MYPPFVKNEAVLQFPRWREESFGDGSNNFCGLLISDTSLSWLNIGNWISDNDISDAAVSFRDKASATISCLPGLYSRRNHILITY